MPHLRLASGNGPSELFALRGDRVVLGRAHECDLILPDVLLSRRHAEIVRGPRGLGAAGPRQPQRHTPERHPRAARGAAPRRGRDRDVRLGPRLPRRRGALRPRAGRGRGAAARRHRSRHALGPRGRRPGAPEPDPRRADPRRGGGGGHTVARDPPRVPPRPPPRGRPRAAGPGGPLRGPAARVDPGRRARDRVPRARGRGPRGRRAGAAHPGGVHRAARRGRGRRRPVGALRAAVVQRRRAAPRAHRGLRGPRGPRRPLAVQRGAPARS